MENNNAWHKGVPTEEQMKVAEKLLGRCVQVADYKGTRAAFAQALLDLAEKDNRVMFVSPDSLKAMRSTRFAEMYPENYIEVGIAEQGAVDTAAGLAGCIRPCAFCWDLCRISYYERHVNR